MRMCTTIQRMAFRAGLLAPLVATLLAAASPLSAEETAPAKRDTAPRLSVQTPYGFNSGGSPGSYYFQTTPGTAFSSYNATRGFTDLAVAQPLGFAREYGLGNVSATLGARVAEPLIANGFTPAIDDRRYAGAGPRLGLQGNAPVNSAWNLEWQVGASMLFNTGAIGGNTTTNTVTQYSAAQTGSVVNVDGLLGLTHWFDAASKLTLGYRADAYLNNSQSLNLGGVPPPQNADRIDHGPIVRFTIQK
jgi:major outer membrane protein